MELKLSSAEKEGFYNVEEKFRSCINTSLITGSKKQVSFLKIS